MREDEEDKLVVMNLILLQGHIQCSIKNAPFSGVERKAKKTVRLIT